jgi:hypothetical protein
MLGRDDGPMLEALKRSAGVYKLRERNWRSRTVVIQKNNIAAADLVGESRAHWLAIAQYRFATIGPRNAIYPPIGAKRGTDNAEYRSASSQQRNGYSRSTIPLQEGAGSIMRVNYPKIRRPGPQFSSSLFAEIATVVNSEKLSTQEAFNLGVNFGLIAMSAGASPAFEFMRQPRPSFLSKVDHFR